MRESVKMRPYHFQVNLKVFLNMPLVYKLNVKLALEQLMRLSPSSPDFDNQLHIVCLTNPGLAELISREFCRYHEELSASEAEGRGIRGFGTNFCLFRLNFLCHVITGHILCLDNVTPTMCYN